jgi:Transposase DDE domain
LQVLGDSAYGTAEARAALADAGHTAIIKPLGLRRTVPGGFTLDDFSVDEQAGTVTCPAGVTKLLTRDRSAVFGLACHGCPLRPRCTKAKNGRVVRLHPQDAVLRQARRDWATREDLRQTYRQHRPMVERSIAWLIGPKGRCRKLRYRGVTANDSWLHTRMAALNLRRLINLGLNQHNGTWLLAQAG